MVTAAHCLEIPSPQPARYDPETATLENLIGALDSEPRSQSSACLGNLIADISVLGEPDGQRLPDEHDAYEAFVEARPALALGDIPQSDLTVTKLETHPVRVLRLDGQWIDSRASHVGRHLSLHETLVEGACRARPS